MPNGGTNPLTIQQLAQWYDFPEDVTGKDQRIAIIELSGSRIELTGGFYPADINQYFERYHSHRPKIETHLVSTPNAEVGSNNPLDQELLRSMIADINEKNSKID